MKTLSDLVPTRREALKFGTLSMLGAFAETAFLAAKASGRGQIEPTGNCAVLHRGGSGGRH